MSAMTITEKIIAAHADRDAVRAGEIVMCRVDLAMAWNMVQKDPPVLEIQVRRMLDELGPPAN